MRIWGVTQGCGLYGERDETRDHLFFACPYSFRVWEKRYGNVTNGQMAQNAAAGCYTD